MPPRTPTHLITVDPSKPAWEQKTPLHNRWHPEIPPVSLPAGPLAAAPKSQARCLVPPQDCHTRG